MNTINAGINTFLLAFAGSSFNIANILNLIAESFNGFSVGVIHQHLLNDRMLRRNNYEGNTINGISTGSINRQLLMEAGNIKGEFQTFATANPVTLHGLYSVRPAL